MPRSGAANRGPPRSRSKKPSSAKKNTDWLTAAAAAAEEEEEEDLSEVDVEKQKAVQLINKVLTNNGLDVRVANFEQLQELKFTHYYIEIYERIFDQKIEGIERQPTKVGDFVKNTQLVIDSLQHTLGLADINISGEKICLAHTEMICDLIQLLADSDSRKCEVESDQEGSPSRDDFIYRYLKSKLKPYVDGLSSPLLPKPEPQNRQLAQKQQSFLEHSKRSHRGERSNLNRTENVKREAARARNMRHKQKVQQIQLNKFKDDLDRERKARSDRKANHDEQLFKKLFVSAVKVEREALREEQRKKQGEEKRRQLEKKNRREAMTQWYADQAQILKDKIRAERTDKLRQEKEHRREMEVMEKEMHQKMMSSLRHKYHQSFEQQQAEELRQFDAGMISSKLLQTLAKGEVGPRHSPRIAWSGDLGLARVDEYDFDEE